MRRHGLSRSELNILRSFETVRQDVVVGRKVSSPSAAVRSPVPLRSLSVPLLLARFESVIVEFRIAVEILALCTERIAAAIRRITGSEHVRSVSWCNGLRLFACVIVSESSVLVMISM